MQSKKLIHFYAFLWIITVYSKKLSVQVVLGSEITSISPRYGAVHKLCKAKEEGGVSPGHKGNSIVVEEITTQPDCRQPSDKP